jgi:hypothetical protein
MENNNSNVFEKAYFKPKFYDENGNLQDIDKQNYKDKKIYVVEKNNYDYVHNSNPNLLYYKLKEGMTINPVLYEIKNVKSKPIKTEDFMHVEDTLIFELKNIESQEEKEISIDSHPNFLFIPYKEKKEAKNKQTQTQNKPWYKRLRLPFTKKSQQQTGGKKQTKKRKLSKRKLSKRKILKRKTHKRK